MFSIWELSESTIWCPQCDWIWYYYGLLEMICRTRIPPPYFNVLVLIGIVPKPLQPFSPQKLVSCGINCGNTHILHLVQFENSNDDLQANLLYFETYSILKYHCTGHYIHFFSIRVCYLNVILSWFGYQQKY